MRGTIPTFGFGPRTRACIYTCIALALLGVGTGRSHLLAVTSLGYLPRRARPLRAIDSSGRPVAVSPGHDRPCLLLFMCLCPDCLRLASQLATLPELRRTGSPEVLGIVRASPKESTEFGLRTGFPGALLADPAGDVHYQYAAGRCPSAWLVNRGGLVFFSQRDATTQGELARELRKWMGPHGGGS